MSDRMKLPVDAPTSANDAFSEGGLRAPSHLGTFGKLWWWFDFLILVKLARLRFIAILILIGAVITQWDWLMAHYQRWTRPPAEQRAAASDSEYFCPMHPTIVRDNHNDKCPICFMPLSKRKKGMGTDEALPPGVVNRVQLSPYRVVLAGVETFPVDYVLLSKQITTVGYVEFNERELKNVSARVKGRIDALYVNETGQMVKAGDELASLYSPELVVTMQNLLDARTSKNQSLYRNAAERLKLWGIGEDQIERSAQAGKAETEVKIRSPISGHVIKKYVREGQYVEEGTPLYDVADLSTVWIQAQIYEDDMPFLPGHGGLSKLDKDDSLPAIATTRAIPSESFHGTLTFIHPHVDPNTRTLTVRFELENPGHRLRPGMTAVVTLNVPAERIRAMLERSPADAPKAEKGAAASALSAGSMGGVLAVPESSIIDTGRQTIVYREEQPGVFEGIEVRLGPRMTRSDGVVFFPVLAGLSPGDRVVTSGSFLVDAETRLNPAAGSIYFGGSGGESKAGGAVSTVRPSTPEDKDSREDAAFAKLKSADRRLARSQKFCAVQTENELGSMGTPVKVIVEGEPVFLCCEGCKEEALADAKKTLQALHSLQKAGPLGKPEGESKAAPIGGSP